jgi:hypothetical protein
MFSKKNILSQIPCFLKNFKKQISISTLSNSHFSVVVVVPSRVLTGLFFWRKSVSEDDLRVKEKEKNQKKERKRRKSSLL